MKYYMSIVIKKAKINQFGKLEYETVSETTYTDDIKPNDSEKRIRFKPTRVPHRLLERIKHMF